MAKFVKNENESPEVDLKNMTVRLAGMGLDDEIEDAIPGKNKKTYTESEDASSETEENIETETENESEVDKEVEEFFEKRAQERDLTLEKVEAIESEMSGKAKDKAKENADKADSSEETEDAEEEKKEPKILKEKKSAHFDGVAVAAICLAVLALIGGCVYLFFSSRQDPSLKITEKDFRVNYFKTAIYKNPLIQFGFNIAPSTYRDENGNQDRFNGTEESGTTAATTAVSATDDKYRYFDNIISNSLLVPIYMTGRECKDTMYIKDLRFCAGYETDGEDKDVIFIAYAAFLQSIYTDRTSQECVDMVKKAFDQSQASTLPAVIIKDGDYAYSVSINVVNDLRCIVMDIIPAKEAKDYTFKYSV